MPLICVSSFRLPIVAGMVPSNIIPKTTSVLWSKLTFTDDEFYILPASPSSGTPTSSAVYSTKDPKGEGFQPRNTNLAPYQYEIAKSHQSKRLVSLHRAINNRNAPFSVSEDNGVTWTAKTVTHAALWNTVATDGEGCIIVSAGSYNDGTFSFVSRLARSMDDGATWNSFIPSTDIQGYKLWWVPTLNRFIMCGYPGFFQSTDKGTTWTSWSIPDFILTSSTTKIICSPDTVVVANDRFTKHMAVSKDNGITWTFPVLPLPTNQGVGQMAYGAGIYVVIAGNKYMTSTDALTWTLHNFPDGTYISDVQFGNNQFVFWSLSSQKGYVYKVHVTNLCYAI